MIFNHPLIPISPIERYRLNDSLIDDPSQSTALNALEDLFQKIHQTDNLLDVKGLYLWGKVGRGKTYLMDIFYASLIQGKNHNRKKYLRQHFHHFMADIHQQLTSLSGTANPLKVIAHDISQQYAVICFDEFFVSDIGDAMLLGTLFQYLFKYHVILVATSNIAPEDLYKDGLQRIRFMPAIDAILLNALTIHLDGPHDHRKRKLAPHQIYFQSDDLNKTNSTLIERLKLKQHKGDEQILGRDIPFLARSPCLICFDFSALCEGPRSHFDYIELAKRYKTVLLLNVPALSSRCYEHITARGTEDGSIGSGIIGDRDVVYGNMDDAARRFIALIDELYDQKVILYLTSPIPLDQLYTEGSLILEFQRAQSRLSEMASEMYVHAKTDRVNELAREDTGYEKP